MGVNKSEHPAFSIPGVSGSRVLRLTLSASAFEVTGTDEKPFELRNKKPWITSRLIGKPKNGVKEARMYDYVLLIQGYGNKDPWKLFRFRGMESLQKSKQWSFSSGLKFQTRKGDFKIHLSRLIASSEHS